MTYTNFTYYKESYFGVMNEEDFERLSRRATEYIQGVTFGMSDGYNDKNDLLKKAVCAVADAMLLNEKGGGVVSETVGKITRNYAAGVSNSVTENQRIYEAATRYLLREGLFYLGVE